MKVVEEIKEKCCSHCEAECDGCWLKEIISDHTKQVRKEVCEDIKEQVIKHIEAKDFKLCNWEYANGYCYGLQYDLAKILNQIEQGEKEV